MYLRLAPGQTLDDVSAVSVNSPKSHHFLSSHQVPQSVIEDAAQLVKANSIQGNKMNDVDVVGRIMHPRFVLDVSQGVHNVG